MTPCMEATDPVIGRWFRLELSDGHVVCVGGDNLCPWVDIEPLGGLDWKPIDLDSEKGR